MQTVFVLSEASQMAHVYFSMRGRDGRPHAQRTGEEFFKRQSIRSHRASKPVNALKDRDDMETYYINQQKKLELQMEKAETSIFRNCVFYVLGFVGRGSESRYNLSKIIEKNGGRTVFMMTPSTTHIITRNICHRRQQNLEKSIANHKITIVVPEYIDACVKAGRLLAPDKFSCNKPNKSPGIDSFFKPAAPQDNPDDTPLEE